jgi:hypothetical protein
MSKDGTPRTLSFAVASLLGLAASSAHAALVYVDAAGGAGGNTVNHSNNSPTDWFSVDASNTGTNNLWGLRSTGPAGVAFGATAYEANTGETAPTIRTTISGLTPNSTYGGLRLYFIGKPENTVGNEWAIDVSTDGGANFDTFRDPPNGGTGLTPVNTANGGLGAPITPPTGGDTRYYIPLDDATTDSNGNLIILLRQATIADTRGVYDGVAYDNVVPEPAGALTLAACGLATLLRRHRRA